MFKSAYLRRLGGLASLALLTLAAACTLPTAEGTGQPVISGVPQVEIVSPQPNATYLEGVSVVIQAAISNAGADVERVEVAVDGAIVATFPQPNPSGAPVFSITQAWPITALGTHTVSVTAFRADGTSSTPETVEIRVIGQSELPASTQEVTQTSAATGLPTDRPAATAQNTPSDTSQNQTNTGGSTNAQTAPTSAPTNPPQPTDPPAPTNTNPPPTSSRPVARMNVGVNIRSGPSTAFNPPIGSLAANAEAELLGVNPAGDWYKIRYYNAEGWVYGPNVTISGNTANLPVDAGPPTPAPTPVPPTPVPATPVPTSSVNYTITSAIINPHPFTCAQDSSIKVTITNNGTAAATDGGFISVQDFLASTNQKLEETQGAFPALQPGQSFTAEMFLRVNTNYNVEHRTVITIDSTNQVVESNENDNQNISTYVLQKGSCP